MADPGSYQSLDRKQIAGVAHAERRSDVREPNACEGSKSAFRDACARNAPLRPRNGHEMATRASERSGLGRCAADPTVQSADSLNRPGQGSRECHGRESVECALYGRPGNRASLRRGSRSELGRCGPGESAPSDTAELAADRRQASVHRDKERAFQSKLKAARRMRVESVAHAASQSEERMLAGSKWIESGLCFTSKFGTPSTGQRDA